MSRLPYLAHALTAAWLFADCLFSGRLLFFRDISIYYYPNYVFLERALRDGLWPLWNPTSDAGAPFLIGYPIDVLMVLALGAKAALRWSPPLHALLAMCGASLLARRLGAGAWGVWAAGAFFGASGFVLSSVNLFELFHAAALLPWVLWALLGVLQGAARAVPALGLLLALQLSTLSAEAVAQTAFAGLVLGWRALRPREAGRLFVASVLGALMAAPVLLGTLALLEGTRRAGGLPAQEAFAWSATPLTLLEAALPRFFGDVHTFSDWGFWGGEVFSGGFPYILSLYLGPVALALAACSGRGQRRLWLLAVLGVLVALGDRGPLAPLLTPVFRHFRVPAKFLLLTTLALALLAARGADRAARERLRRAWLTLLPGALLVLVAFGAARDPDLPGRLLGGGVPELRGPRALTVIRDGWPRSFGVTGVLCLAAAAALCAGPRVAPWAAVLGALDALIVNTGLNPTAPEAFYARGPELAALLRHVDLREPSRLFSYGVAANTAVRWTVPPSNNDLALYYMERQSLLPRTHVLDGLEGAFDEELGLFAPQAATLRTAERTPLRFAEHHARLRLANVRWVLSFGDLPPELVTRLGEETLPGIQPALRLFELRDPLPRAFWVGNAETVTGQAAALARSAAADFDPRRLVVLEQPAPGGPAQGGDGRVAYRAVDAHTVQLRVESPPGWVVVLNGFHRGWRSESGEPLWRAYGLYTAVATPGGEREFTLRYRPAWLPASLGVACLGGVAAVALALRAQKDD